jgi:hypothetical protein
LIEAISPLGKYSRVATKLMPDPSSTDTAAGGPEACPLDLDAENVVLGDAPVHQYRASLVDEVADQSLGHARADPGGRNHRAHRIADDHFAGMPLGELIHIGGGDKRTVRRAQ